MFKILIVDDDRDFLITASQWVEDLGYACLLAGSPQEALDKIRSEAPECCILDMRFGRDLYGSEEYDGLRLFEELKTKLRRCRTIFMSAYTDYEEDFLLRRGATRLVDKSLFTTEIETALKEAFYPRALLVEDDIDFALSACDLLSTYGVKCVRVGDSDALLDYVKQCDFSTFDVIIIDALLDDAGGFNGWDVMKHVPNSLSREQIFFLTDKDITDIQKRSDPRFSGLGSREKLLSAMSSLNETQILDKSKSWSERIVRVCSTHQN